MSRCHFVPLSGALHRCVHCGQRLTSPHPSERIYARCRGHLAPSHLAPAEHTGGEAARTPEQLAAALAADVRQYTLNRLTRATPVDIEAKLAVCRACSDFLGDNCRRYADCCAHARDWVWALVEHVGHPIRQCAHWRAS